MADKVVEEVQVSMDDKTTKNERDLKKSNKICYFYSRNKRCKFGDKCRFVHSERKTKTLEVNSGKSPDEAAVANSDSLLNKNEEISRSVLSETTAATLENAENIEESFHKASGTTDLDSIQTTSLEQKFQNDDQTSTETQGSKVEEENISSSKKRCRFFFTKSGCARGDACKFSHTKQKDERKPKKDSQSDQSGTNAENKKDEKDTKNVTEKPKSSTQQKNKREIIKVVPSSTRLSTLDENELKKLRTRELNQVERGFGKLGLKTVQEDNETVCYINFAPSDPDWPFDIEVILLVVTFPENYPKTMFRASLSEDQDLPLELIRFTNKGISKWLDMQQKARNTKDTVDLPFRPFLRWLDRNVEELFVEAAREMKEREEVITTNEEENLDFSEEGNPLPEGKEAVECGKDKSGSRSDGGIDPTETKESSHYDRRTVKKSQHKQKRKTYDSYSYTSSERKELLLSDFLTFKKPNKTKGNKGAESSKGSHGNSTQVEETSKDHIIFVNQDLPLRKNDNEMLGKTKRNGNSEYDDVEVTLPDSGFQNDDVTTGVPLMEGQDVSNDQQQRGTEIRFKALELSENTATLTTDCVALMMECLKCKTKIDAKVEKTRSSAVRCDKCSRILRISFRPSIIHQYSSTLGYLDLEGWQPFDLIMTELQITAGCLACSQETNIKGPHYGTNQVWCSKCHQKLAFSVESTRFFELTATGVQDKNDISLEKPKKKPKAPGLREGFPLPDNGTCKHYKKSFRWLRFPCCGKCYPCDVCHEEHEDHDFKFANRMVCGFCSKEQPYSQGACVACSSFTTKAKTSHWEGGKGCRNRTLMSKGDNKKFKNTTKTTSRKAQAKDTPKAKAK